MKLYHYDVVTGELAWESDARLDPLELARGVERPLVPANATIVPPPEAGEAETPVFDPLTMEWRVDADFRGRPFYDSEGGVHFCALGETPDPEWTTAPPQTTPAVIRAQLYRERVDPLVLVAASYEVELSMALKDARLSAIPVDEIADKLDEVRLRIVREKNEIRLQHPDFEE